MGLRNVVPKSGNSCLQHYKLHIKNFYVIKLKYVRSNLFSTSLQVSQEERSIFWEVTVSVILSKKKACTYIVLLRAVSKTELLHCTAAKLLIRTIYHVLFLISVFTVQMTKLVQFTQYNSKIPPSTSMHFATRVRTMRVACSAF